MNDPHQDIIDQFYNNGFRDGVIAIFRVLKEHSIQIPIKGLLIGNRSGIENVTAESTKSFDNQTPKEDYMQS